MRIIYPDLQYAGLKTGAVRFMDMAFAEVTEKIRALLKSYPEGLSITSISSLAG
jgi:ABC-type xylose transport system substrate-binding protein